MSNLSLKGVKLSLWFDTVRVERYLVLRFRVRPANGDGVKAVDERKRGKHLRSTWLQVVVARLVAAFDLGLFQSARGSGTTCGQGEQEEDEGQKVELVHHLWWEWCGICEKKGIFF